MNALEIGQQLVAAVNQGRQAEDAFVDKFYSEQIVSLEGPGPDATMARLEGLEAVKGKHAWFYDNHEVHSSEALGPYVGHNPNQFVVRFVIDATHKDGGGEKVDEVGLFTVTDGKITQEEFLYLTP